MAEKLKMIRKMINFHVFTGVVSLYANVHLIYERNVFHSAECLRKLVLLTFQITAVEGNCGETRMIRMDFTVTEREMFKSTCFSHITLDKHY